MIKLNFATASLVLCASISIHGQPAGAPIYRCTDSDGRISMQDSPCSRGIQQIAGSRPLNRGEIEAAISAKELEEKASRERLRKEEQLKRDLEIKRKLAAQQQEIEAKRQACGKDFDLVPTIGTPLELFRKCRRPDMYPTSVNVVNTAFGTTEYWHFGGTTYVFTNGRLSATSIR